MQDHGELVYLDMPRTGSTFVVGFLKASCRLPLLGGARHVPVAGPRRPGACYFATVRHPVALYVSLFRHGSFHRGGVRGRIDGQGRGDLYEKGFDHWLAYLLDPAMAPVLGGGFERVAGSGIGPMTFRFVALSIPDPLEALESARSVDDVRAVYEKHKLTGPVIRNEALNDGLRALAFDDHPEWFDHGAATQFLASRRINASFKPGPASIDPALEAELLRRERLLLDLFYRDGQPDSSTP